MSPWPKYDALPYRADNPKSGHQVPKAGTLHQISYCQRCGQGWYYQGSCAEKAPPPP